MNLLGAVCFALFILCSILSVSFEKSEIAGLYTLMMPIFLIASAVFTIWGVVLKKLKRRKKTKIIYISASERRTMIPYTESDAVNEETDQEAAESETEEVTPADEHVYQVYHMSERRPKVKKRKKDKGM